MRLAQWCRAPFQIANVRTLVGHDQCPLELTRIQRVDAEIRHKLHRAPHARRHVYERPVAEHGRVEGRKKVVAIRHDRPEILLHEVGMVPDRLGHRAEDHSRLLELLLVGRRHRYAVEHRVDGNPRELLLLLQRDSQLAERLQQFRVYVVETLRRVTAVLRLRSGVVVDIPVVDGIEFHLRPRRLLVLLLRPVPVRPQPPVQHPFRLVLLLRDQTNDVLVDPLRRKVGVNVRVEAILVVAVDGRRSRNNPCCRQVTFTSAGELLHGNAPKTVSLLLSNLVKNYCRQHHSANQQIYDRRKRWNS